jgi:hypothetical protein
MPIARIAIATITSPQSARYANQIFSIAGPKNRRSHLAESTSEDHDVSSQRQPVERVWNADGSKVLFAGPA